MLWPRQSTKGFDYPPHSTFFPPFAIQTRSNISRFNIKLHIENEKDEELLTLKGCLEALAAKVEDRKQPTAPRRQGTAATKARVFTTLSLVIVALTKMKVSRDKVSKNLLIAVFAFRTLKII